MNLDQNHLPYLQKSSSQDQLIKSQNVLDLIFKKELPNEGKFSHHTMRIITIPKKTKKSFTYGSLSASP